MVELGHFREAEMSDDKFRKAKRVSISDGYAGERTWKIIAAAPRQAQLTPEQQELVDTAVRDLVATLGKTENNQEEWKAIAQGLADALRLFMPDDKPYADNHKEYLAHLALEWYDKKAGTE